MARGHFSSYLKPVGIHQFFYLQPLRDCTISCLLSSFLYHGPDHLPCLELLEALFSVETVTDNVDLWTAMARDLRVLLDTKVNTEIRLGRFAYGTPVPLGSWSSFFP